MSPFKHLIVAMGVAAGSLAGCGDDSAAGDTGGADEAATDVPGEVAADADAVEDDGAEGYAFDFFVFELDPAVDDLAGDPIEGVLVAVDLPAGRQDLVTGADGSVHVTMPAAATDVTLTAAKVGWLPVTTIYRATIAELEERIAEDGRLYAVLEPPVTRPAETVVIRATSTGTLRYCASVAFYDTCTTTGSWTTDIFAPNSERWDFVADALGDDGCPLEQWETELPDMLTDLTIEIPFEGTGTTEFEHVEVTLRLPTDPTSPFRTIGLMQWERFPALAVHDLAHHYVIRGGTCAEEVSPDGSTVQATAWWFPPASGELNFVLAGCASGCDWWSEPYSVEVLRGPPTAGTYDVLDIPRMSVSMPTEPRLTTTILPPSVPGANTFDLMVIDGDFNGSYLWLARSFRLQEITLPALPAGYDRSADWPSHNRARYRVRTCEEPIVLPRMWPYPDGTHCALSGLRAGDFE